jgi:hypothetical protein
MAHPTGEINHGVLELDYDHRLMLQFRGSVVTSHAGLLAYRADALGLSAMAGETSLMRARSRTVACAGRVAAAVVIWTARRIKDVRDAERLRHDPEMR